MKRSKLLSATCLTCLALNFTKMAHADPAELTAVIGRLGISSIEIYRNDADAYVAPSPLLPHQRNAVIEKALTEYTDMRNAYTSALSGGEQFAAIADLTTGVGAATKAVPLVLVGVAARLAIDAGNAELNRQLTEKSTTYLASISNSLVEEAGVADFDVLVNDPDLLKSTLLESEVFLSDISIRAQQSGDPALMDAVTSGLVNVALDASFLALELAPQNAAAIEEIEDDFNTLVTLTSDRFSEVEEQLSEHQQRLGDIEDNVSQLQSSVVRLDETVGQLGRNQDLIADFVFSKMTPQEKLHALNGGLLDSRINCPTGQEGCDATQVRQALIDRYEAEAKLNQNLAAVSNVLTDVNAVFGIANDLGLDLPPEIGEALNIANGAFNAFTNFASGNILGGISAISGLFGGSRDVGAERHAQLMNLLQSRFNSINQQLDQIRGNQQKIMEGLVTVSGQIDALHRNMDGRLRVLEYELGKVGENLKELLWSDWLACEGVYRTARFPVAADPSTQLLNPESFRFLEFDGMRNVVELRRSEVIDCISALNNESTAISSAENWSKFGSILDLDRSVLSVDEERRTQLQRAVIEDGNGEFISTAAAYRDNISGPSSLVLLDWANRNNVTAESLLYALASGPTTMVDAVRLQDLIDNPENDIAAWRYDCNDQDARQRLISDAICRTDLPGEVALSHLTSTLNTNILPQLSRWLVVVSQLADLYRGDPATFANSLSEVADMEGSQIGYETVRAMVPLGNIAIAYEQRLYGGLSALIIADDILAGRPTEAHITLLNANRHLAENTALALLHNIRGTTSLEDGLAKVTFEKRYTQALLHARSGREFPLEPLEALFGSENGLVIDQSGLPAIEIIVGNMRTLLPMPGPIQLSRGEFVMPSNYSDVVAARNLMVDRLIDYELGQVADLALLAVNSE